MGVLAFAALVGWQTAQISSFATYAQVGPTVVPWIVTAMLAGLGIAILVQGWFGYWTVTPKRGRPNRLALAWLGLGLFLNAALIGTVGFIVASTVLFVCTARAFDSRHLVRDAAIGFALALSCYLAFDRLLGYRIGGGVIENLL